MPLWRRHSCRMAVSVNASQPFILWDAASCASTVSITFSSSTPFGKNNDRIVITVAIIRAVLEEL